MARKKVEEEAGGDGFTVMFTSLSIILLAFFIVLNSIAVPSDTNRRKALSSLIGTFGMPKGVQMLKIISTMENNQQVQEMLNSQLKELGEKYIPKILEAIEKNAMVKYVEFSVSGQNIEIIIDSSVMFAPGDDQLADKVYSILDSISEKAIEDEYPVVIEGHTDSTPISTSKFPSNWELSSYRALSALRYMVDEGGVAPFQIMAFGYGDSRPVAPNNTAENRARNRRIKIDIIGAGAMGRPSRLKSWWDRIGITNPFGALEEGPTGG